MQREIVERFRLDQPGRRFRRQLRRQGRQPRGDDDGGEHQLHPVALRHAGEIGQIVGRCIEREKFLVVLFGLAVRRAAGELGNLAQIHKVRDAEDFCVLGLLSGRSRVLPGWRVAGSGTLRRGRNGG